MFSSTRTGPAAGSQPRNPGPRDLLNLHGTWLEETLDRTNFTLYEARAIVEIVRPGFEHSTLGLTEAVEHGLEDGLAEEWNIDSESLLAKLRDLDPRAEISIIDACLEYWARTPTPGRTREELIRAVGFRVAGSA